MLNTKGNELNGIVSDLLRHIPLDVETPIQVLECAQRFGIFQLKMAIAEHCLTEAINAKNWMRIHSTAIVSFLLNLFFQLHVKLLMKFGLILHVIEWSTPNH